MKAFAPNGLPILGTLDTVTARAETMDNGFSRQPDGSLKWEYYGETEVFWDGQETVEREVNGKKLAVFLDSDGNEWTEDQIKLRDDPD